MNPYTFETMIAEQKFKLQPSNKTYVEFYKDCCGNINSCQESSRQKFWKAK